MKLKELNEQFQVIKKVYDKSVTDFQRRVDLIPAYKELKSWTGEIEEERKRLAEKYGDENGTVPEGFQAKANKEFQDFMEGEIGDKIEKPLKFKVEEVKKADLSGSELALIYDEFVEG